MCHHAGSLDFEVITAAAGYLRKELDFYIFGFDVIIEKGTGEFPTSSWRHCNVGVEDPKPKVSPPMHYYITLTMLLLDRPTLHRGP